MHSTLRYILDMKLGLFNVMYKPIALCYVWVDKGGRGVTKSCLGALKLCIFLLRGWGRYLEVTLQPHASKKSSAQFDGGGGRATVSAMHAVVQKVGTAGTGQTTFGWTK